MTRRCRMVARTDNKQQRSRPEEGGHGPSTPDTAMQPDRVIWLRGSSFKLCNRLSVDGFCIESLDVVDPKFFKIKWEAMNQCVM